MSSTAADSLPSWNEVAGPENGEGSLSRGTATTVDGSASRGPTGARPFSRSNRSNPSSRSSATARGAAVDDDVRARRLEHLARAAEDTRLGPLDVDLHEVREDRRVAAEAVRVDGRGVDARRAAGARSCDGRASCRPPARRCSSRASPRRGRTTPYRRARRGPSARRSPESPMPLRATLSRRKRRLNGRARTRRRAPRGGAARSG